MGWALLTSSRRKEHLTVLVIVIIIVLQFFLSVHPRPLAFPWGVAHVVKSLEARRIKQERENRARNMTWHVDTSRKPCTVAPQRTGAASRGRKCLAHNLRKLSAVVKLKEAPRLARHVFAASNASVLRAPGVSRRQDDFRFRWGHWFAGVAAIAPLWKTETPAGTAKMHVHRTQGEHETSPPPLSNLLEPHPALWDFEAILDSVRDRASRRHRAFGSSPRSRRRQRAASR